MSCTTHNLVYGTWKRCITDDTLGIKGLERITFYEDSTFTTESIMNLSMEDSLFKCEFGFTTSVKGYWLMRDDTIYLHHDIGSYRFDSIPGQFAVTCKMSDITSGDRDMAFRDSLSAGLSEYYFAVYNSVSDSGIALCDVHIETDSTLTTVNEGSIIRWEKYKLHAN